MKSWFGARQIFVRLKWSATCIGKRMRKNNADQAGDDQGLPDMPEADSESVKELVDEGQAFEASVVDGIEESREPEVSEVRTRQVPEDDVPPEYLEQD